MVPEKQEKMGCRQEDGIRKLQYSVRSADTDDPQDVKTTTGGDIR